EGNLLDIVKSGGLGNYLRNLHEKYGDIASFWLFGPLLAVSVSSPNTADKLSHLFDKPTDLYEPLKAFVGKSSILFTNGNEARQRRALWNQLLLELLEKWADSPKDEHIPVQQYMKAFFAKLMLSIGFGDYFKKNGKLILEFGRTLEVCWLELESRVGNYVPEEESVRHSNFVKNCNSLREHIDKALQYYEDVESSHALLEPLILSKELKKDEILDDCMTYILKTYSLSTAAAWVLYELASKSEEPVLRDRNSIDNFVNKTLCNRVVESWTARVNNHVDEDIAGNTVPKGTPIVFALNSLLENEENCEFIFGCRRSKRYCPANNFSIKTLRLLVDYVTNNFMLNLVSSDLKPQTVNSIIERSEDELWITVTTKK
ncbi:cytochrome P450 20A1-like protein, partial [Leptotrombidium deliense]